MKELEEFLLEKEKVDPKKEYGEDFDQWKETMTQTPDWRIFLSSELYHGLPKRVIVAVPQEQEQRVKGFIEEKIRMYNLPYVHSEYLREYEGREEQKYQEAS